MPDQHRTLNFRAARMLAAIDNTRLRPFSLLVLLRKNEQAQVLNHRCEILGGFSERLRTMVARDGVEPPTPAFSEST